MRTIYSGGLVFDSIRGRFEVTDIAVSDGLIAEVGSGLQGDTTVDLGGLFVVPGLIDCHVHINAWTPALIERSTMPFSYQFYAGARNLALTLASGVTTVRDAGGADAGLKKAIEAGLVIGPDVVLSINAIGTTGGHTDPWKRAGAPIFHWMPHPGRPHVVADGAEEMRKVARLLFRAGADWLKVCTSGGVMSPEDDPHHSYLHEEEVEALVAEASIRDTWVMSHAQGREGIRAAVLGGVRSIEHGTFLDEELAQLMVERNVWLVPTLSVTRAIVSGYESGTVAIGEASYRKALAAVEAGMNAVRVAEAAGVKIAMGTDAGVGAHGEALTELDLLAEAGLAPERVWQTATSSAAEMLGLEASRGTIRAGAVASFAAFAGEPSDFGDLKSRIREVVHHGDRVAERLSATIG